MSSGPLATSQTGTVGEELRAELEATRRAYHDLLSSLSVADWNRRSGNRAWTIGEVLFHMTLALRFLPAAVRLLRGRGWAPKLPASLFDWVNVVYTRLGARRLSLQTVGERYDAAHDDVLRLLETIREDEWSLGREYPDWDPQLSGHVTLETLFRYPAIHFATHAEEIRSGLASRSGDGDEHGV
jgi:hypothetical protein